MWLTGLLLSYILICIFLVVEAIEYKHIHCLHVRIEYVSNGFDNFCQKL